MEALSKLFGSESRVKILRLFFFNPEEVFRAEEVARRAQASVYAAKHELKALRRAGFVRPKGKGFALNERFLYLAPLRALLLDTVFLRDEDIYMRFAGAGKLKVVIVAGVFTNNSDSRLDLLIAGEKLRRQKLADVVRGLEAEIGKELSYAAFDMQELAYRMSMYDRLLRDVMEHPHRTLLDKASFESKFSEKTTKK
jgi:hypothetical protein